VCRGFHQLVGITPGSGGELGSVAGSSDLPSLLPNEGLEHDLYEFENDDIAMG